MPVELSVAPDYLARLIVMVRGVQGREALVDEESGSNPTDDDAADALQETPGDLSRREVAAELRGLGPQTQAELVALMWTGRGDAEPDEWEQTVELAAASREMPTELYLMGTPLLAEYWADGMEKLGIEVPIDAEHF
ncbi:MAG: DUF3775 domain-containing protein [Hyphomicrobiaceae bacterium]